MLNNEQRPSCVDKRYPSRAGDEQLLVVVEQAFALGRPGHDDAFGDAERRIAEE